VLALDGSARDSSQDANDHNRGCLPKVIKPLAVVVSTVETVMEREITETRGSRTPVSSLCLLQTSAQLSAQAKNATITDNTGDAIAAQTGRSLQLANERKLGGAGAGNRWWKKGRTYRGAARQRKTSNGKAQPARIYTLEKKDFSCRFESRVLILFFPFFLMLLSGCFFGTVR
jgi:hypothetical protein